MYTYILRRVLLLIPTMLIVSVIVFLSVRLIPGDVIDVMFAQMSVSSRSNIPPAKLWRRRSAWIVHSTSST